MSTHFSPSVQNRTSQIQILVSVEVDNVKLSMEVDTGASVSLVSEQTYQRYWPNRKLERTSTILRTYSGEALRVVGKHREQTKVLVVEGDGPNLFGRDWLAKVRIDWHSICIVRGMRWLEDTLVDCFRKG